MRNGMLQEIMAVASSAAARSRIVRATGEFADTRYRVWKALHGRPHAALEDEDAFDAQAGRTADQQS